MHITPAFLASLLILISLPAPASSDVYYLRDGGKVEGVGVDLGDRVVITVPLGSITVLKTEILRVVKKKSIIDLYREERARTAQTADARHTLALWCESAGLHKQVRIHLREVLAIDPNHAAARKRLGFRRVGNRWMTDDEYHEWKGEIRFRGKWMPPETVAAILQAEVLQKKLAARRQQLANNPQGGNPPGGNQAAGNSPAGNSPAGKKQGQNNGGGGKGVLLSRSLRPSQRFLDKYFVTNPFNYGSAGARIRYGGQYNAHNGSYGYGPVYYGPYSYDGASGGPSTGVYYRGGAYGAGYSPYSGRGNYGGGLRVGYTHGQPGDKRFYGFGLSAGSSSGFGGSTQFVGHSFFGSFRAGKSRVSFSFR